MHILCVPAVGVRLSFTSCRFRSVLASMLQCCRLIFSTVLSFQKFHYCYYFICFIYTISYKYFWNIICCFSNSFFDGGFLANQQQRIASFHFTAISLNFKQKDLFYLHCSIYLLFFLRSSSSHWFLIFARKKTFFFLIETATVAQYCLKLKKAKENKIARNQRKKFSLK